MHIKDLPTKWWYRLLQVVYGIICFIVLGFIALLAFDEKPRTEIDYEKSTIVCETSGDMYRLQGHYYDEDTNSLNQYSDADAKKLCANSYQTTDEYKASQAKAVQQNEEDGFFSNKNSSIFDRISAKSSEQMRLVQAGYGEYHLEIVEKLSQPWGSYLETWGIAFSIAIIILFAIRQATLYILAGRS